MSKRKASVDLRPGGVKGVMKELQTMEKAGFIVDVDESNAKLWRVSLNTSILKTHGLGTLIVQLQAWARRVRKPPVIVLELQFADNHPFDPPFVRIVRPRFQQYTGHITVGGSICSKLVTADGWRPNISTESLFRTILGAMNDGNARI
jgi:ubiquitin-conjugating enzyme E2 Q